MSPHPDPVLPGAATPAMRSDADEASARGDIAAAGGGALKLLVPLDGSAASQRALEYALGLAAAHPASGLVLLNVQTGDELGLWDPQARGDDERFAAARRSQKVLRRPFETCRERHLRCEVRAEYGDAVAETIVRIARETGADQIVMGARGLGRLRGLILGSVTTQVVHLADIPVTLVKARPRHRLNS